MRHRKSAWRCRCPQRSVRACSYPPILANAMFSPATVRASAERSRRRAICSDAGLEAPRRNRLRRRARNDPRCGFVDDGLSATGPLAVEKSDDFPTAQPFAHKLHSAPIICIEIILEDTRRNRCPSQSSPDQPHPHRFQAIRSKAALAACRSKRAGSKSSPAHRSSRRPSSSTGRCEICSMKSM